MRSSIWRFQALDVSTRFIRTRESNNGSTCCIYRKITPREVDGIIRNATRCWKNISEFITFHKAEAVIIIAE